MMPRHLQALKAQIEDIVFKNDVAPELERLSNHELIVDTNERNYLLAEGEKQVRALKEAVRYPFILGSHEKLEVC